MGVRVPLRALRGRILGSSASKPSSCRNPSGIYIETEGCRILLDCGEGIQRQILAYGETFMVDVIILSHHHMDHTYGVKAYLHTMNLLNRVTPLRIYTPDEKALKSQISGSKMGYPLKIIQARTQVSYIQNKTLIKFFRVAHGKIPALGVLIQSEKTTRYDRKRLLEALTPDERKELFMSGVVVRDSISHRLQDYRMEDRPLYSVYYSGDTVWVPSTVMTLSKHTLVIHECSYVRSEDLPEAKTNYHTHYLDFPRQFFNRRVILTHISDRVSPTQLSRYPVGPEGVWAYDGLEFEHNL